MNDQIMKIQEDTRKLRDRLDKIEAYFRGKTAPDKFVEYKGVFFKKDMTGGYCEAVFCPTCLQVMLNTDNGVFVCKPCNGRSVDLRHKNIKDIIKEMQGTLSIIK